MCIRDRATAATTEAETKTETKAETTDTPAKEETKAEDAPAANAEAEEGGEEKKDEDGTADAKSSNKRSRRKWPFSKGKGAAAKSNTGGSEEAGASGEKTGPTDAEIEAELQKKAKELESERNKLKAKVELHKKVIDLENEVKELKAQLAEYQEGKPEGGGNVVKPFVFQGTDVTK
ncbi:uncharacterized protein LOC117123990 [Anneissia japonica]|uniref:uncharacterized protein LOC117123990 n=1 Tax=Anneissia japonica TaxID=1529436 RepID=UPI00142593EB|nr:uncharacterized protein LOC117123990 [Anneissia japonica]